MTVTAAPAEMKELDSVHFALSVLPAVSDLPVAGGKHNKIRQKSKKHHVAKEALSDTQAANQTPAVGLHTCRSSVGSDSSRGLNVKVRHCSC